MILADKIVENRKKNGWSQEELADRLGVSRQSVSKWESAQAVPDMKRILQLSELFGVTTDYLIKDEIQQAVPAMEAAEPEIAEALRVVSMEEANAFLAHNERSARTVSTGVLLCILSPIPLIFIEGLAEIGVLSMAENTAAVCGIAVLLIMVAAAVGMFLHAGLQGRAYGYLEDTSIDTAYGVNGMTRERRASYAETHSRLLIIGIMLCIIAAVPMLLLQISHYSNNTDLLPLVGVCLLLGCVAAGVKLIVLTCMRQSGFDKLLEEGDYSRLNKRAGKFDGIYWAIITAGYLAWSFLTNAWEITWVVWPVAGILFGAYHAIVRTVLSKR